MTLTDPAIAPAAPTTPDSAPTDPGHSRARTITRLPSSGLTDRRGRGLRDLRISITDRCNFRCVYCMPKSVFGRDYAFLDRDELLSFEEITRIARAAAAHGVEKLRLTGGEPLLRRGIEELIAQLAELRTPDGRPLEIALTTNGAALAVKAQSLRDAGLSRVTVSLDSLDDARFQAMNDVKFPVGRVLDGIDAAHAAGLGPIKLNMVVKRGMNDDEILPMARHFKGTPYTLRFIEYMDVGNSNGWSLDEVVPSSEIVERIGRELPLEPAAPTAPGETAARWRYADGEGEIGVISSVTNAFCGTCNRARLSTEGKLFTCLFATDGHDLRALLRGGASDDELSQALGAIWGTRDDRYSEVRSSLTPELRASRQRVEMSYIGG
ncbi:GTP 3',8-cyclase MoaA [Agromyces sp. LHK192]|uniref:GTP 3',8-cyclase MoaA n=1 Tax=Agromyces sp. LHK192 TaxID=2498704 RepID=UPI000FD9502E|nr:GTP 3',8-cyclase MoaA [Agromyces sp. LHK192]